MKQTYTLVGECLYRSEPSGIYYALFKRGGKQIRRSLKTANRALADRKVLELRQKISILQPGREKAYLTFTQVAEVWLNAWKGHLKPASSLRREVALNQLRQHFGELPVRNITRAKCEAWAEMRNPQVAASTFNQERDTLQLVLEHARREGLILDNPVEIIQRRRQPKAAILIPSREQFKDLVDTLRSLGTRHETAADFVELLAYSGMRKAEANAFHLRDVDFERGTFTVTGGETGTKNHEARTVPLFPVLREFLERLKLRHPRLIKQRALVPVLSVKKSMATACKLSELPHFTHHCLRHYFVSNALEKGIDFKTIAAWIGHKDGGLLVAKTYGHLRDTHSFEMAKLLTA